MLGHLLVSFAVLKLLSGSLVALYAARSGSAFQGGAMIPAYKMSITDLEMGVCLDMLSPTGTALAIGHRSPGQPRFGLCQLPDHFKDAVEDGSTFNAACPEFPHDASTATVPGSAHPQADSAISFVPSAIPNIPTCIQASCLPSLLYHGRAAYPKEAHQYHRD